MSHSPLRVGVIGCGFFAEDHLAAWAAIEDVTLSADCDLDIAKARSPAQKRAASHLSTSATDLMDSGNVDFVDVATTMHYHAELVGLAAARGIPVIVQKPFAPTYAECVSVCQLRYKIRGSPCW